MTIKDAPFELSGAYIQHHIKTYGDVVENSLRRGKISEQTSNWNKVPTNCKCKGRSAYFC